MGSSLRTLLLTSFSRFSCCTLSLSHCRLADYCVTSETNKPLATPDERLISLHVSYITFRKYVRFYTEVTPRETLFKGYIRANSQFEFLLPAKTKTQQISYGNAGGTKSAERHLNGSRSASSSLSELAYATQPRRLAVCPLSCHAEVSYFIMFKSLLTCKPPSPSFQCLFNVNSV